MQPCLKLHRLGSICTKAERQRIGRKKPRANSAPLIRAKCAAPTSRPLFLLSKVASICEGRGVKLEGTNNLLETG